MVKLVATDIDGTLLRSDKTVSPRTRQAVADVEEAGIGFVLVTGRPPRWLGPIKDQLDHRGVAICANGGLVVDLETDEVLQADGFDRDTGMEVLAVMRELAPGLAFGVEWADGFANDPTYPRGVRNSELVPGVAVEVASDAELFGRQVIKILVRIKGRTLEDLLPEAIEAIGDRATLTWSDLGLLEISAAGITKASALARYVHEHDVTAPEVVAFGDMPNDLPMLEWAGHAVAVANAHHSVVEAADEITASNDDDGVALILERVLSGTGSADRIAG